MAIVGQIGSRIIKRDFHAHSIFSDGRHSPGKLVQLALQNGISEMAITDHEHYGGLREGRSAANSLGIEFLTGIELHAMFETASGVKKPVHILGYAFKLEEAGAKTEFNQYLAHLADLARDNVQAMCDASERYPFRIKLPDGSTCKLLLPFKEIVKRWKGNLGAGVIDWLSYLSLKKIFPQLNADLAEISWAFRKQKPEKLGPFKARNNGLIIEPNLDFAEMVGKSSVSLKESYYGVEDAVRAIIGIGGVPVLAHPGEKENGVEWNEIFEVIDKGVVGIEAASMKHTDAEIETYVSIGKKRDLLITGGTDYHGENHPRGVQLGMRKEGIPIECDSIEKILARRPYK